jgi:quercetin dioxygenase-like cupin family protein
MAYYNIKDREFKNLMDGVNARTFWGENMLLAVVDLDAHAIIPNHSHPHEQGGMVISGEVEFYIEGEHRLLHQGDIYVIPSGADHKVVVGANPAQVLDIFSPVREEYKY